MSFDHSRVWDLTPTSFGQVKIKLALILFSRNMVRYFDHLAVEFQF